MSKRYRTGVIAVVAILIAMQLLGSGGFPQSWNIGLSEPINSWQSWIRTNRDQHWLFTFILNPITWTVEQGLNFTESFIGWLPWFVPPVVVFAIIAKRKKWIMASFAAFAVIYPGLVGVWQESIETISLMAVSVGICILLGVPIGIKHVKDIKDKIKIVQLDADENKTIVEQLKLDALPTIIIYEKGK